MSSKAIDAWHEFVSTRNSAEFNKSLADNVVFHSPVVHTPQEGRAITMLYLEAAHDVLANGTFSYQRELVGESDAVLEFNATVNGVIINGVDMISWDKQGNITDFKVMIRPLQAIKMIHHEMAVRLQVATGRSSN